MRDIRAEKRLWSTPKQKETVSLPSETALYPFIFYFTTSAKKARASFLSISFKIDGDFLVRV